MLAERSRDRRNGGHGIDGPEKPHHGLPHFPVGILQRPKQGGSVLVHVEHDRAEPDIVAIAVQDDGPGIPDDQLPFLFERRPGALHVDGLALSLVRDIVSAHGGDVRVESRRDAEQHGTSITLRFRRRR